MKKFKMGLDAHSATCTLAVLTTKFDAFSSTRKEEMSRWIDASLRRLQTDHIDCLLVHQIRKNSGGESIERLQNPELFEVFPSRPETGEGAVFGLQRS